MPLVRKLIKYLGILVVTMLALFLIVWLLIRIPTVQTWLVHQVSNKIEQKLGSAIEIDKVDIKFFSTVVVEGIYIGDLQKDTLLSANALHINLGLFSIFDKQISVDNVIISDAHIHLHRDTLSGAMNYDHLVKALTPDKSVIVAKPWTFDLKNFKIINSDVRYIDKISESNIQCSIGELSGSMNTLDLNKEILEIERLYLSQALVDIENESSADTTGGNKVIANTIAEFPTIPWQIRVNHINLNNNALQYHTGLPQKTTNKNIDFNHLDLTNINMSVSDLAWIDKSIKANIEQINLSANNKLIDLKQLNGVFALDTMHASVHNMQVETATSILKGDLELYYPTYDALIHFDKSLRLVSSLKASKISEVDIRHLIPDASKIISLPPRGHIAIDGKWDVTQTAIQLDKFQINIANQLRINATGGIKNPANLDQMNFNILIKKFSTSCKDLNELFPTIKIPESLNQLGSVAVTSSLRGSLNNLSIKNMNFHSDSYTTFLGSGSIQGIMNATEPVIFDMKVDTLRTRISDWQTYINVQDTQLLDNLGIVEYSGMAKGKGADYTLNGLSTTTIGQLKADLNIAFTDDYTNADYRGELYLKNFDLNKVMPDSSQFGMANIYFIGKGNGLQIDNLNANMEAIIESLEYKDYKYEYVNIEGDFANKKFEGYANFEDDHAAFEFQGLINLENELPEFDFKVKVDTINFMPLHITDYPVNIHTNAQINFIGTNLSNIDGSIILTELAISDSSSIFKEDNLSFLAKKIRPDSSILIVKSSFLEADILGQFDLDLLPVVSQYYINDFIALNIDSILSVDQRQRIQDQQFSFDVRLTDSKPLSLAGLKEAEIMKRGTITGQFDYQKNSLNLDALIIEPVFGTTSADTLTITANGSQRRIKADFNIKNLFAPGINIPIANLKTRIVKDSLKLSVDLKGADDQQLLLTNGVATADSTDYIFEFDSNITLNNSTWSIDPNNGIHFSENRLFVDRLKLSKDNGSLLVQSQGVSHDHATTDIDLDFTNFELGNLLSILASDQNDIQGLINGKATIAKPLSNTFYSASLDILNLKVGDQLLGDLAVSSSQRPNSSIIDIDANLVGNQKTFSANGTYHIDNKIFDIVGNIDNFELALISPFVANSVSDLAGKVTGQFTLKGTPNKPNFESNLLFENVHCLINFLNTEVNIASTEVHVDRSLIDLGNIEITGAENKKAVLYGAIFHNYFKNFDLNLEFQSPDFQVMNTTELQNNLFWGTLNLNSAISITGSLDRPVLDIDAVTLDNSTFVFQINNPVDGTAQSNYILFANPNNLDSTALKLIQEKLELANKLKIDLTINLDVTKQAEATIILDPITGDKIVGRGNAALVVKMNPAGDVSMIGTYNIQEGAYRFSYGQFVNKEFSLENNGRVIFSGDPLKSQLDLTASYTSQAAPFDLINNEALLSSQESAFLKRRTSVRTMLLLKGDLVKPDITFDIQMPNTDGTILNSALSRKLVELRSDPAEMNKQVFSLLVLNTFFPSSSAGNLLVGQGENIALSSVSNLISNQLNNLADKLLKGVEVNINLDSYQSLNGSSGNREVLSELKVGLSKTLFNDRIKLSAGTNVGLNASGSDNFSSIAGDFTLEYRLNPNGNYLLKVFRTSDYDILRDENSARNGIGFSAKHTFGEPGKEKQ